ncbi:cell division ATP-binding protein FtsE [Lottiidibacillus patelloidae]|uniref:Cell division ATP-binding protein FtsE n=1 Tax=Lottiidibacillus patelloidae TaxID=2670334 RepID=A0A263BSJ0_9BACI|nr:cell division ATP-binding protein FtsE [Lottiidibacillus patelloidae]OZM56665.1 cell division ATP-binding protein FtsE [Lottiidibacillus patelloidae]
MIEMHGVYKTYPNGVLALNGIDIKIKQGEFVYLVGPSGAGKSSFIKMLYREIKPSKGTIIIKGVDVSKIKEKNVPLLRRGLGVVFQDFKLLSKLTVYENIAFALEVIEEPKRNIKRRVLDILDLVKLKHKARFYPNELSGGEQQRVAIARAIINHPNLLIVDEPTGNLDPDTSWEIMNVLNEINNRGTTIIMATHNKEIVDTMKKRVVAIEKGKIVRDEQKGGYGYED